MVRYFCNRCQLEIEKASERYAAAVKNPAGEQKQYHFCRTCYPIVQKVMDGMDDIGTQATSSGRDAIAGKLGLVGEGSSTVLPEETKTSIQKSVEEAQQEVVAWPKGKEPERLEPAPKDVTTPKADPTPTVIDGDGEEPKGEDVVHPVVKPKPKAVLPGSDSKTTVSSFHEQSKAAQGEKKEPQRKVELSDGLPKKPTKRANLDEVRRIMIDFYREVAVNTIIHRHKIDYNRYYYCVNRYGSKVIKERHTEDAIKEKVWTDTDGTKIDALKLISLYAAGFTIDELAEREFHIDSMLVLEILEYYTGL